MLRRTLVVSLSLAAASAHAQSAVTTDTTTPPPTETTAVTVTPPPPATPPAPVIDPTVIAAIVDDQLAHRDGITYKDGFHVKSADGAFVLTVGGYTQFDGRFFVADDADKNADTFAFRRIRPDITGTLLGRADFRLLTDFAGGKAVVQDAWIDVKVTDQVKIQVGKMKAPFGLERLQSATNLLFVERALPTDLVPNRDLGVQVHGDVGRVSYALGVFNGVADGGSSDGDVSDDKDAAARLFVTAGAGFGAGGAATYGATHGTPTATDLPQLKTSGQATFFQYRTGTTLDDTAIADGTHWRATAQGTWYGGPVGVLAEYVHGNQQVALASATADVKSDAWAISTQAVIGGTPSYKGVTVAKPFAPSKHQWGAVELDARYHELRISDAAFVSVADAAKSSKRARAFGVGASWHLSKQLRFELNLERTTFDGAARGAENLAVARAQAVF